MIELGRGGVCGGEGGCCVRAVCVMAVSDVAAGGGRGEGGSDRGTLLATWRVSAAVADWLGSP